MKNLGVLIAALALAPIVLAETNTPKSNTVLKLALNAQQVVRLTDNHDPKGIELDQSESLKEINKLLENKVEQKFEALISTKLPTLD